MTAHLRTQIRLAAVAAVADLATTGANVFASRRYPLGEDQIPALCVYTLEEDSDVMNMGSTRHLQRELRLVVEGVAKNNDALDDVLDEIATEVEVAMAADASLGGLCKDSVLVRTQIALQPEKEAEAKTGSVVLTYRVVYRSNKANPTSTN
jgi:hypothetical protein